MRMRDIVDLVEVAQNPTPDRFIYGRNGKQLHDTPLERARQKVRKQTFGTPEWEEAMQVVRDIITANEAEERRNSR